MMAKIVYLAMSRADDVGSTHITNTLKSAIRLAIKYNYKYVGFKVNGELKGVFEIEL